LEEKETMLELTADQLYEACEHLYEALRILESVLKEIGRGAIRGLNISEDLGKAWFEVNCCRLYTQADVNLEELNLDAMGLINDAQCMMDSLVDWEKGLTPHGKLFISQSIVSAAGYLKMALDELESLLYCRKTGEFVKWA
jgi:hypothetical protein